MSNLVAGREMDVMLHVVVPMRDGVGLATSVFLPKTPRPCPVALVRTAYNRMGPAGWASGLVRRGIGLVVQDVRGRYDSPGEHVPFVGEAEDGYDTVDWIVAQPWSTGDVGMLGDSYLAIVQMLLAPLGHPALKAINPRFMSADLWRQGYYCDGALSLALVWSWLCLEVGTRTSKAGWTPLFDLPNHLRSLPLATLDERSGVGVIPAYRDYLAHYSRDAFWQGLPVREHMDRYTMPTLLTGGWYDYYPNEAFRSYAALVGNAPNAELARRHRVLIGPWTHGINSSSRLGHVDFGPQALAENDASERWLACLLNGRSASDFQAAPIRIFVMGINQWRDEYEWPPARMRPTAFHLDSAGAANSLLGDGRLCATPPAADAADRYTYNPANPVPTLGGNHSVGPYNPGLYDICLPGPYDQRPNERRDDVLTYTTPPLADALETIGPVVVRLFAASSAPDTDFVARLCDVHPDGRSINITEGVLRGRFRRRHWDRPEPLAPGAVLEWEIHLQPTAHVFLAGHRIRLDVTSSNFPLWDRNLNTGGAPHLECEWRCAEQSVHHGPSHPSRVILPVVPHHRDTPCGT